MLLILFIVPLTLACFCPAPATRPCGCSPSNSYATAYSSQPSYSYYRPSYSHYGLYPRGLNAPGARTVFYQRPVQTQSTYSTGTFNGPSPYQPGQYVPQRPVYHPHQHRQLIRRPYTPNNQKWTQQITGSYNRPTTYQQTGSPYSQQLPQNTHQQPRVIVPSGPEPSGYNQYGGQSPSTVYEKTVNVPAQPEPVHNNEYVPQQRESFREPVPEQTVVVQEQTTAYPEHTTRIVPIQNKAGDNSEFDYFYVYYDEDDKREQQNKIHEGEIQGKTFDHQANSDVIEGGSDFSYEQEVEVNAAVKKSDSRENSDRQHFDSQNAVIPQTQTTEPAKSVDTAPGDFTYYDLPEEELFPNSAETPSVVTVEQVATTYQPVAVTTYAPAPEQSREPLTTAPAPVIEISVSTTTAAPHTSTPEYEYEEYEVEEIVPVYEDGHEGVPQVVKIITTTPETPIVVQHREEIGNAIVPSQEEITTTQVYPTLFTSSRPVDVTSPETVTPGDRPFEEIFVSPSSEPENEISEGYKARGVRGTAPKSTRLRALRDSPVDN